MASNNIDVMGVLNSITSDQTLAKAEQIDITSFDGLHRKIPNELFNYVRSMTSTQLVDFMTLALNDRASYTEDRLFLCTTSAHSQYTDGHFYWYNGSDGSIKDITPAMGGEGGGGSGSGVYLNVSFKTEEIDANKEFTVPFTWSSRNTGRGKVLCTVDGSISLGKTIIMTPGTSSWTISGLSRGTHILRIIALDSSGLQSSPWEFTIKVGSLTIESDFNQNVIFEVGSTINLSYKYYTNEPTKQAKLLYTINGEEFEASTGNPEVKQYFPITGLAAGEYTITLQIHQFNLDSNDQEIDVRDSNIKTFVITVAAPGVLYLSTIGDTIYTVKQRDRVTLNAKVTYIGGSSFSARLAVYKLNNLNVYELDTSTVYGTDATWGLGTNSYILSFAHQGQYKCIITVGYNSPSSGLQEKSVEYYVTVQKSELATIDPVVDTSLLLHLSAQGKSNNDVDRATWQDTSISEIVSAMPSAANTLNRTPVNVTLNNFNWGTNGWFENEKGETYLNVSSGAYVTIDLQPFKYEVGTMNNTVGQRIGGLTVDVEFETEDILYNTAKVISCFDGQRGFWIDTEYATLANSTSKQKIEVTEREEVDKNEVIGYENKVDANDNPLYIDAVTGEETTESETIVDGVPVHNARAQKEIYATYTRYTQTGPFQTNFMQNTKTRITFVIQRGELSSGNVDYGDYQFPCMCIYVNGVLTAVEKIYDQDYFSQASPKKIYLGCDYDGTNKGKAYIYNLRVYDRALSMTEVLTNYVADINDAQEQNDMIERNALIPGTESASLPVMDFYVTEDDWANMSKDTKIFGRFSYMDNNNLVKSIPPINMRCQWQGTSTLAYAVKNLKIRLYNTLKKSGDELKGDDKYKYDLGNGIPEYIFTLKADYMDSMHGRNTAIANFVSDIRKEAICPPQEYRSACRTSIYGFPIQLYVTKYRKKSFDETSGDIIFDDNDIISRELYGVYNFNLDKNSTDSLGMDTKKGFLKEISKSPEIGEQMAAEFEENYPNWDCMSFEGSANSDIGAGAFNSTDDVKVYSEFELRFEDEGDILDEGDKTSAGAFSVDGPNDTISIVEPSSIINGMRLYIDDINSDLNGEYTIEAPNKLVGKRHIIYKTTNDILTTLTGNYTVDYNFEYKGQAVPVYINVRTNTYGEMVVTTTESAGSRIARRYSHLKKFIKWVLEADDEEFRNNLHKHCDIQSTLDYYVTTITLLLADNFGKNLMWDTWGPISTEKAAAAPGKYTYTPEEVREYDDYIWYPHFYDLDTCLGLDNSGNMRFDVSDGIEIDKTTGRDDLAQGVFNTSKSKFWVKFRNNFADEITARYKALREYDDAADSAASRRATLTEKSLNEYFYDNQIAKISEAAYNADFKQKYLMHSDYLFMMHGRQYEHFQRFISQRLYFLDTFFGYGNEVESQATVRVEYGDFAERPVIFNISTYKPAYVTVIFTAANATIRQKVPRNTTVEFKGWVNTATDQEVRILNAPNIKSFGDVSSYSPKTVDVSAMTKLTELSVGTTENYNPNLMDLSLGSNTYLTRIVAENCTALNKTLDVSGCSNLKYISTVGSATPSVKFNYNGGNLEEAHFSYATTSISLHNFNSLRLITVEELDNRPFMERLTTMDISGCPLLTGYIDSETGEMVDGYLSGNILDRWEPVDQNTTITIDGLYGKMSNYTFLDACSVLHGKLLEESEYDETIRKINISGQIDYVGTSIPTRYSTYNTYFPNLTVTYNNVTNFSEMFKDYKNINAITTHDYVIVDPVTLAVRYETRNYWVDPKYEQHPNYMNEPENYDKIDNVYYRKLNCYDEQDQINVADEIKERLRPFRSASDFSEMFANDAIIERIHDDTFDVFIDKSAEALLENPRGKPRFSDNIKTLSMFEGCENLQYVELPRVKNLDSYMFKGCPNTVVFVPQEATNISDYAFQNISSAGGQHHLVLFEGGRPLQPIDNIRDARFNITRHANGRALKTENISCPYVYKGTPESTDGTIISYNPETYHNRSEMWLKVSYFLNDSGMKLIYSVDNIDQQTYMATSDPIRMPTWNIDLEYHPEYADTENDVWVHVKDIYSNPLNIDEMLYGSMKNFDTSVLKEITIPTFNVANTCPSAPGYAPEEVSFARLFNTFIGSASEISDTTIVTVNLLMDTHPFIFQYMFYNAGVSAIHCQDALVSIGNNAFDGSRLNIFDLENRSVAPMLISIGERAFANTRLNDVFIPDSVRSIGQYAFSGIKYISTLHYSENMLTIPIGCFQECNDETSWVTYSITGFSPDIVDIGEYAFYKSSGLMLVATDGTEYGCYWNGHSSGNDTLHNDYQNNYYLFDYFRALKSVGKFAFDSIRNIKTIKLNPTIEFIGSESFAPPLTECTDNLVPTRLMWDMGEGKTYRNTVIQTGAFLGREFDWQSNIGGYTGIIKKCVFIPGTVKSIGSRAFAPHGGSRTSSTAELYYTISNAVSFNAVTPGWDSAYAQYRSREEIFNFKSAYIGNRDKINMYTRYYTITVNNDSDAIPQVYYGDYDPTVPYLETFPGVAENDIFIRTTNGLGAWTVYRLTTTAANHNLHWELSEDTIPYTDSIEQDGSNLVVNSIRNNGIELVGEEEEQRRVINYQCNYQLSASVPNALYFLLGDAAGGVSGAAGTAIYVSFLEGIASASIPKIVTYNGDNYVVTRLANEALIDNGALLNSISFATDSLLQSIGGNLFDGTNITTIEVEQTDKIIPGTVSRIGTGTPYIETTWFGSLHQSDFVYLNNVCIGYAKGDDDISLGQNPSAEMNDSTTIIYDNAFKGMTDIEHIKLPSALQRIETNAFSGCESLQEINFSRCENSLQYIGDGAFSGCTSLTEMVYTKALRHVGAGAVANDLGITRYVFKKGCMLDQDSAPVYYPSTDERTGLNTTIKEMFICQSMGDFFANSDILPSLAQLKTLVLGDYDEIDLSSCLITENGVQSYRVNLVSDIGWSNATYTSNGAQEPIILTIPASDVPNGVFYKAIQEYESNIDIRGISRNYLTQLDIIQTVMGIKPNLTIPVTVTAKGDITSVLASSTFRNLLGGRLSTRQEN